MKEFFGFFVMCRRTGTNNSQHKRHTWAEVHTRIKLGQLLFLNQCSVKVPQLRLKRIFHRQYTNAT
jgi:hypothetical protein